MVDRIPSAVDAQRRASPSDAVDSADADRSAPIQGLPHGLRILHDVGRTPEGRLYQARYPDGTEAALLILHPTTASGEVGPRDRLRRAARIRHPNVALVYEAGNLVDGSFYAVLEQFAGVPLSDAVAAGRVYTLGEAVDLTLEIAAGLEAASAEGFVHGNLSPATIVAMPAPGTQSQVKLTGFTLRSEWPRNEVIPSPALPAAAGPYASPERLNGHPPDERSEVFSLGAVFHYLLTGIPPASGRAHRSVPKSARALLARALAQPPDQRFQTISELALALRQLLPAASERRAPAGRARVVAALGVALALVAGSWLLSGSAGREAVGLNRAGRADSTSGQARPQAGPTRDVARLDSGASPPVRKPPRARADTASPPTRQNPTPRNPASRATVARPDQGDETGMVAAAPPEPAESMAPSPGGAAGRPRTTRASAGVERRLATALPPASGRENRTPSDLRPTAAPVRAPEAPSRPGSEAAPITAALESLKVRPAQSSVPPGTRRVVRGPTPPPRVSPSRDSARRFAPPLPEASNGIKTAAEPRSLAELRQNQGLGQAIGDIIRLGIAEDVAERRRGALYVRLAPAAMEVPSAMYNLQRLYLAYSAATEQEDELVVELWQGRQLYGRFTRAGLMPAGSR